ncbi:MAG: hypothetical protein ABJB39_04705 [Chloroflexota bacterium]
MIDREGDVLDETTLRRALRLEADERAPRFDSAAIAAAARTQPRLAVASALVALAFGTVGVIGIWAVVVMAIPAFVADAFDLGLGALAMLAVPASTVADLVQQPVVPLSLFVALAIATAHELRERVSHVSAS